MRRTFTLDDDGYLISIGPTDAGEKRRLVVKEHEIIHYVDHVHNGILHRGWDATWKEVSERYYGILRADINFLLKRCPRCLTDPIKATKNKFSTEILEILEEFERDGIKI